jgi:hypothetical protein
MATTPVSAAKVGNAAGSTITATVSAVIESVVSVSGIGMVAISVLSSKNGATSANVVVESISMGRRYRASSSPSTSVMRSTVKRTRNESTDTTALNSASAVAARSESGKRKYRSTARLRMVSACRAIWRADAPRAWT